MGTQEMYAYSRYDIITIDEEYVEVHFQTNDDGDTGYPGKYAQDTFFYKGSMALKLAKRHCGVSRQGVGHRVIVTLDGKVI